MSLSSYTSMSPKTCLTFFQHTHEPSKAHALSKFQFSCSVHHGNNTSLIHSFPHKSSRRLVTQLDPITTVKLNICFYDNCSTSHTAATITEHYQKEAMAKIYRILRGASSANETWRSVVAIMGITIFIMLFRYAHVHVLHVGHTSVLIWNFLGKSSAIWCMFETRETLSFLINL